MKIFSWSDEKNERLKRDRKVSFEAVLFHIERGDLLDIVTHPNHCPCDSGSGHLITHLLS